MDEDNFVVSFYSSDNKGQWLKARFNEIGNLQQENKELKSRIDKAIEKLSFIDNALEDDILSGFLCIVKINNTIKILRGDSNE